MLAEENKALVRSAIQEFNKGNIDSYLAYYHEDLVTHGYPPQLPANLDGLKAFYGAVGAAFPDAKVELGEMVAEGDKVATLFTFRATHRGDFMGILPTNRGVSMDGITILRFRDGRISERWQGADMMGLMQQLGAASAPQGART